VAGFQPLRRRVDLFFDDAEPTDEWMAQRNAWVAARDEAEAAGRELWNEATRAGREAPAPTADDVIRLGAQSLRGDDAPTADGRLPSQPDASGRLKEQAPIDRMRPVEPDGPMRKLPNIRFATARRGDSISRLLGTSDPAAIGRFLTLNGLDGPRSGLTAGRTYAVPRSYRDASNEESAAGARLLRADNARLAALRAERARQGAQGDRWAADLSAGRNVWTGEPVGPPTPSMAAIPRSSKRHPRSWLDDSAIAKEIGGDAALALAVPYGVVRGGVHTLEGAINGAAFVARLPFDRSAQEQAAAMGKHAVDYVRTRAEQPELIAQDTKNWLHSENVKLNPYATPMADTFSAELQRRFGIGANLGETLFDAGSLVYGGEIAKGLEGIAVARELPAVEKYVRSNFAPDLAEYMLEPYPLESMGSHYVARRTKLPDILGGGPLPSKFINSKYNVSRLRNANRYQQYKYHFENDPNYRGGAVRGRKGKGTGWSGERTFGWKTSGPMTRAIVGMPADTRGLIGGTIASSVNRGYDILGEDEAR
jgi:hypothetical protein